MCGHQNQRIAMTICTSRSLKLSVEDADSSCHAESVPPLLLGVQGQDSSIEDKCSILFPQFQLEEGNKRSRDFGFMDVLDYKAPCTSYILDSVDLLSDRFSQLGRQDSEKLVIVEDSESDSESSGTPRKRICRGLVRTKKSAKLHLLGSLSQCDASAAYDW